MAAKKEVSEAPGLVSSAAKKVNAVVKGAPKAPAKVTAPAVKPGAKPAATGHKPASTSGNGGKPNGGKGKEKISTSDASSSSTTSSPASKIGDNVKSETQQFRGGQYAKLKRIDGWDRHHMPADSITSLPRNKGPSIHMERKDHALTSSHGNSRAAQNYREQVKRQIDEGDFRGAMATEVRDVKKATGRKYNKAMQEMLSEAKKDGFLKKESK